jgi:hypothetical protein
MRQSVEALYKYPTGPRDPWHRGDFVLQGYVDDLWRLMAPRLRSRGAAHDDSDGRASRGSTLGSDSLNKPGHLEPPPSTYVRRIKTT